jgi:hypothetical protein
MELVAYAKAELIPQLDRLLELTAVEAPERWFFSGLVVQAHAMRAEEDVLALFFELSTTAFHGFAFDVEQARAIDELLVAAERIAFTMTASGDRPH